MISRPFMRGTGFMKCMPMKFSGFLTEAASRVMGIEEVFEATIASSASTPERLSRTFFLMSRDSGTASTTKPQPANSPR